MERVFQEEASIPSKPADLRHVPYGALQRQKLDVYFPKDGTPRAVIVFFHGGGWTSGNKRIYPLLAAAFTGRGYAVVVPNYRLYPSARFPDFMEDAALAIKWTDDNRGHFGGAPMFVMGHSAGAHIGALLALDPSYLRAHGIEPSHLRGIIGIAGPYTMNPAKWPIMRDIFAAASPPESARPIKLVREQTVPMLLLHGAYDRVAKEANSTRLAEALKNAGSVAELKVYPRIGHFEILLAFVWGWRWRAKVLDDVDAFIKRTLERRHA
ncbi:MAG: alpha/beta fold hydrolase [Alphaproteobacteria bacterium]|nr:alpha/beta fold hydrolase [Alphaproteobacteria bacterium]